MDCTEAYREHIMYSFNGFCKVVIRYAAINAWRDRNRRRQREISFELKENFRMRADSITGNKTRLSRERKKFNENMIEIWV